MKSIEKIFSKILIIVFTIALVTSPVSVFAEVTYSTATDTDRAKIQEILPGITFDGNTPSVGIEREISKGETIYFENVHGWTDVRIYIYGDGELSSWGDSPAMTKVSTQINGHDVYKYTYDNDRTGLRKLIFYGTNESNQTKQTVDLSFYRSNIYFSPNNEATSDGKYEGWWYYYDKTELTNYVNIAKALETYSTYFVQDTYAKVVEDTTTSNSVIASTTTKINYYYESNNTLYIDDYSESLYNLTTSLSNLRVNTKYIEEEIAKGEKIDTSKISTEDKQNLENAIATAKEVLNQLTTTPNLFSLNPATTSNDATSQSQNATTTLEKLATALKMITSISQSNTNGVVIPDILTNPSTASIMYAVIFIGIVLVVCLVSFVTYFKKKNKNDKKGTQ